MRLAQGRSWPPPSLSSSSTLAAIARRLSLAVRAPCGVDPLDLHSISRFCPIAPDASDPGQSPQEPPPCALFPAFTRRNPGLSFSTPLLRRLQNDLSCTAARASNTGLIT
ncbi:hypothetical protein VTO73DRAFT_6748 [Trametes versicolor]